MVWSVPTQRSRSKGRCRYLTTTLGLAGDCKLIYFYVLLLLLFYILIICLNYVFVYLFNCLVKCLLQSYLFFCIIYIHLPFFDINIVNTHQISSSSSSSY